MTATICAVQTTMDLDRSTSDRGAVPVEVLEHDGSGQAWLKLDGEWRRLAHIENLWELAAIEGGAQPAVGLHFRAVTDEGRTVRLVQDLCRGGWFRQMDSIGASTRGDGRSRVG